MSIQKTIGIILGTILALVLMFAGFVALLVYLPPRDGESARSSLACPEENYTFMCVIRSYLVPQIDRS